MQETNFKVQIISSLGFRIDKYFWIIFLIKIYLHVSSLTVIVFQFQILLVFLVHILDTLENIVE